MAENKYGSDDDDSLDKFEQKMKGDEKSKSRQGMIRIFLVVLVLVLGGYLYYSRFMSPQEAVVEPPPTPAPVPAPAPAEPKKVETPAVVATPVKPKVESKETVAKDAKSKKDVQKGAKSDMARAEKPSKEKGEKAAKIRPSEEKKASGKYMVVVGSFAVESNATRLVARLEKAGLAPETAKGNIAVKRPVVYYKNFKYKELADKESAKMDEKGYKNTVDIIGAGQYALNLGQFNTQKEAEARAKSLTEKGFESTVGHKSVRTDVTTVRMNGVADDEKLKEIKEKLEKEKLPFIVRKN